MAGRAGAMGRQATAGAVAQAGRRGGVAGSSTLSSPPPVAAANVALRPSMRRWFINSLPVLPLPASGLGMAGSSIGASHALGRGGEAPAAPGKRTGPPRREAAIWQEARSLRSDTVQARALSGRADLGCHFLVSPSALFGRVLKTTLCAAFLIRPFSRCSLPRLPVTFPHAGPIPRAHTFVSPPRAERRHPYILFFVAWCDLARHTHAFSRPPFFFCTHKIQ